MGTIEKKQERVRIFTGGRSDTTLIFVIALLVSFSLVMVFSSSYYISFKQYASHEYIFLRQVIWIGVGGSLMYLVSRINYRVIIKFNIPFYVLTIGLLIYALTQADINHSKRWVELMAGIRVQPSEFAKIALIFSMASMIDGFKVHLDKIRVLILILFVAIIPIGFVGKENLSTAIIMMAIISVMLFIGYRKWYKLLVIGGIIFLIVASIFLNTEMYRNKRINSWVATFSNQGESDDQDAGYQMAQSIHAIGAGDFFGVGLGKSIQKTGAIPEAHNDIIFSIICEELGLFGGLSIIMLYILVIWRMLGIIGECNTTLPILIVAGIMVHIGFQAMVNIGVVTELLPPTGVPLPFISYGGSSLIGLFIEVGIVLNIARENTRRLEG